MNDDYNVMLKEFNDVLSSLDGSYDDYTLNVVITLKGRFIDLYGDC